MSFIVQSLSGTESSSFWNYWEVIKDKLATLQGIGPLIKQQWDRAKALRAQTQNPAVQKELDDKLYTWSTMYITWQQAKAYIDEWWPTWTQVDSTARAGVSDQSSLGLLPLLLPAWAIGVLAAGGLAALTFVATHGLDLIQQYRLEKEILDRIEQKTLTAGEGAQILQAGRPSSNFLVDIFGGAIGSVVPLAIGGVALYFFLPEILKSLKQ